MSRPMSMALIPNKRRRYGKSWLGMAKGHLSFYNVQAQAKTKEIVGDCNKASSEVGLNHDQIQKEDSDGKEGV